MKGSMLRKCTPNIGYRSGGRLQEEDVMQRGRRKIFQEFAAPLE